MTHYKPDFSQIIYERKGDNNSVLWLTLNNEKMMNALTDTMQLELIEALEQARKEDSIRCVVLTGAGEKAFCSGGDIGLLDKLNNRDGYDYFYKRGRHIQNMLSMTDKPVIAAVNGYCFAGGTEMALCCDFIYASENARFALTEINLGILPGWGGSVRLPRKINVGRAREMIYTAERITADEAAELGLVNKVFPQKNLLAEVEKTVTAMMRKPPLALRAAKTLITDSLTCDSLEAAMSLERGMMMWLINTSDFKEGTQSFLEKRPAKFIGQ